MKKQNYLIFLNFWKKNDYIFKNEKIERCFIINLNLNLINNLNDNLKKK